MQNTSLRLVSIAVLALTQATALCASDKPADYPLRVRILARSEKISTRRGVPEGSHGHGQANLFQNGEPRGLDFAYACPDSVQRSAGYETFPARWKRPNQVLTILLPLMGKSDKYWSCDLNVVVKDVAYTLRKGVIGSEPIADYKAWMQRRDYDPEHGKNTLAPDPKKGADASSNDESHE